MIKKNNKNRTKQNKLKQSKNKTWKMCDRCLFTWKCLYYFIGTCIEF